MPPFPSYPLPLPLAGTDWFGEEVTRFVVPVPFRAPVFAVCWLRIQVCSTALPLVPVGFDSRHSFMFVPVAAAFRRFPSVG